MSFATTMISIGFNRPYRASKDLEYLSAALSGHHLCGDGPFSKKCNTELENVTGTKKSLLTPSCTAALEMSALLLDIKVGDEIIMPSFTFVSTANAFVLRGAVPVFADIDTYTMNIDPQKIESLITAKTKAIVIVHYAGVCCDIDQILDLAKVYELVIIEDAAQGIMSFYKGKHLGSLGKLGTLSFHETKNISCGEGGALLINDGRLIERAEIIREKGTNRTQFINGVVDKYGWEDIGSSYLPSELNSAVLLSQLEEVHGITSRRLAIWEKYYHAFADLASKELVQLPYVPSFCKHNAHIFFMVFPSQKGRNRFIEAMRDRNIQTVFHYLPLHASRFGSRFTNQNEQLNTSVSISERIVRLPLWIGIEAYQDYVVDTAIECIRKSHS